MLTVVCCIIAAAGLTMAILFGDQALQTYDARSIAGAMFGLALMLAGILLVSGA